MEVNVGMPGWWEVTLSCKELKLKPHKRVVRSSRKSAGKAAQADLRREYRRMVEAEILDVQPVDGIGAERVVDLAVPSGFRPGAVREFQDERRKERKNH